MKPNQMAINRALLERAAEVWREAGDKLRFKVTAPFRLESDGQSAWCIAFLPDFGSPKGVVVAPMMPPAFDIDPLIEKLAKKHGYFCSFMSAVGWEYDEAAIKDALVDWGFFGPKDQCPVWLPGAREGVGS